MKRTVGVWQEPSLACVVLSTSLTTADSVPDALCGLSRPFTLTTIAAMSVSVMTAAVSVPANRPLALLDTTRSSGPGWKLDERLTGVSTAESDHVPWSSQAAFQAIVAPRNATPPLDAVMAIGCSSLVVPP